jgi:hypothetical protein
MYICGVVGNFGGGLLDQFLPQNWIPMFHHHASMIDHEVESGETETNTYLNEHHRGVVMKHWDPVLRQEPLLFAVHAVLAASMATVMYICGVVGNFGGGLLDQFPRGRRTAAAR